ncbi:MAG: cysteine hydrolase [Herbaspirillum sp.]|nr:cysteine hydrolase [Herbaspirillum sp.]
MSNKAAKRALVVIDIQNDYITGNFRIEYPPVASSLANIGKAMDAAKAAGVLIAVVQHVLPADAPIFAEGSEGVKLHPVVTGRDFDYLSTKALPSTFSDAGFEPWLKENGIDTLTVIGYMSHNCVDATIREAMHRGYHAEFLPDAAGSLPYKNNGGAASARDLHTATTVVIESAYAAVMSTEQWIARLDSGVHAPRDNIYYSNQRAIGKM